MQINNMTIYNEAVQILREVYGEGAQFREGQYEAIEAAMTRSRTLIVQKTGWGKSLVYFICTELIRRRGGGFTLVISPLLALMENQMKMAAAMNLRCAALNSRTPDKNLTIDEIQRDRYDIVFITPETLMGEIVQDAVPGFRIGLFVVDEAHCISDWGHDFRLNYSKIGRIIQTAPSTTAVIATTATANDRVVRDLENQLGDNVYVSRGPLTRDSMHMQVLHLEKREERYAWLLDNLPKLPKPGIIYCLDTWDCDNLTQFLVENGIRAKSYHSKNEDEVNDAVLLDFENNRIDVIVATVKLGMGYDKGNVGFVIHFQKPSNIAAWYQQIGRAGRSMDDSYVFLMTGEEDDRINDYFIRSAFPGRELSEKIYQYIRSSNGVSSYDITTRINGRKATVERALDLMENEGFISLVNGRYYSTPRNYVYPEDLYRAITNERRKEMQEMHNLVETKECLSRFAVRHLDDTTATDCGKCSNCTGHDIIPGLSVSERSRDLASRFLDRNSLRVIEPRKKRYDVNTGKMCNLEYIMNRGICLSKYGKPRYGEMVKNGKYPGAGRTPRFSEELVGKSAEVLSGMISKEGIRYITFVPSVNSTLVKDFAKRLARMTGLTFLELLEKTPAEPQKNMQNGFHQCRNAFMSFSASNVRMPDKVLLVDDVVDSRWTLCVCAYKLMEKGCMSVYPFALADSSVSEE